MLAVLCLQLLQMQIDIVAIFCLNSQSSLIFIHKFIFSSLSFFSNLSLMFSNLTMLYLDVVSFIFILLGFSINIFYQYWKVRNYQVFNFRFCVIVQFWEFEFSAFNCTYMRPFDYVLLMSYTSTFNFYFIFSFGALICIFYIEQSFSLLILFKIVSRLLLKPSNEFLILHVLLFSSSVLFWSLFIDSNTLLNSLLLIYFLYLSTYFNKFTLAILTLLPANF